MRGLHILWQRDYKPGDQAPDGYLAWHEWAEVQHKAGLRQKQCGKCGLWRYPQELSGALIEWEARTARGKPVRQMAPLCLKCQLLARHEPHNVEFSGVPAGHSSNHPAGGTSAGTQG